MAKYINALEFKKKYLEQPKGDPGVIFTVDAGKGVIAWTEMPEPWEFWRDEG